MGTDHRSDVASVQDRSGGVDGELALKIDQRLAHPWDRGDDGGRLPHFLRLQDRVAEFFRIELEGRLDRPRLVVEIGARAQQRIGHRAVDHAGIEVAIAVIGGEALAEGAFAGGGRSVDGDNHENSAPSERIIGMKSGKLVAIKAVSSILTGWSAARPITSADIAMRWSMWLSTRPPPGT